MSEMKVLGGTKEFFQNISFYPLHDFCWTFGHDILKVEFSLWHNFRHSLFIGFEKAHSMDAN